MKLKMARLQIVGLKTQLVPTVHTLHQLGCVQIDDVSEAEEISARPLRLDRDMVRAQEELAYLVARIEGLWSTLGADKHPSGLPLIENDSGEAAVADCASQVCAPGWRC